MHTHTHTLHIGYRIINQTMAKTDTEEKLLNKSLFLFSLHTNSILKDVTWTIVTMSLLPFDVLTTLP